MSDEIVVPGFGMKPAGIMVIGEAPGRTEAQKGIPLMGISGKEHENAARRNGWPPRPSTYVTNVNKTYRDGNPDPTEEDLKRWWPSILQEISEAKPKVIVTLGRFAMWSFLGSDADLRACNGVPHFGGEFKTEGDAWRFESGLPNGDAVIVPIYHPAYGLHMSTGRALVEFGYACAGRVIKGLEKEAGREREIRERVELRKPDYRDILSLADLQRYSGECGDWEDVGFDTEGEPGDPWSWQVSMKPDTGVLVRREISEFDACVDFMQSEVNDRMGAWIMHNRAYDVGLGEEMGFSFKDEDVHDSMYALYLNHYPQGLKPSVWRFLRIQHPSFLKVVGKAGRDKQVAWLQRVVELALPDPPKRSTRMNNGVVKPYGPKSLSTLAAKIIADVENGKTLKDGSLVDPQSRWEDTKAGGSKERLEYKLELKAEVESLLGKMPRHSLGDIPLQDAVNYAAADADYTLQLHRVLMPLIKERGLSQRYSEAMGISWSVEEMMNVGFPIDKGYFERLRPAVLAEYWSLQEKLSREYFDGQPFNPKSSNDVRKLLEIRGLRSKKKSKKTGEDSTAKDAIGHLRFRDDAVKTMFEAREKAHLIDAFIDPILKKAKKSPAGDWYSVSCQIQMTRTASRRFATKNPNLLGLPSKKMVVTVEDQVPEDLFTEVPEIGDTEDNPKEEFSGLIIRNGFVAPPGFKFVSADFSAIEIRIAAIVTRDPLLVRTLLNGDDPHRVTASRLWRLPEDEVTDLQRSIGKTLNFQELYGATGKGIYLKLQEFGFQCWDRGEIRANKGVVPGEVWTVQKCNALVEDWMTKLYRGVHDKILETERFVWERGYAQDMWGMRRYLPGIYAVDQGSQAEALRHAFSLLVQGGAQGCMQKAQGAFAQEVRAMQREGLKVWHLLQVHDELNVLCEERIAERVEERLVFCMENRHGIKDPVVPILADSAVGSRWGDLK